MTYENIAAEIAAKGRKITLVNGNEITIRYDFPAIVEIEAKHGSLKALQDSLETGTTLATLAHGLWAGSQRKLPVAAFTALLDPARVNEYSQAFGEAVSEALGTDASTPGEPEAAPAA